MYLKGLCDTCVSSTTNTPMKYARDRRAECRDCNGHGNNKGGKAHGEEVSEKAKSTMQERLNEKIREPARGVQIQC
jgi:hypothetical protein